MKAEIITIGDELLNGFTIDTNSTWIGQRLLEQGIEVQRKTTISDKHDAICSALDLSIPQCQLIIITGGLGPTNDDITKHTLCQYFGTKLVMNAEAWKNTERFVLERGGTMNALNQTQAMVPERARFIPNNNGTASGAWFERNMCVIVSLPGVPHEMKQMMTESVLPMIASHFKRPAIAYRTILTTGIPESQLAIYLNEWEASLPKSIKLAYLPTPGQVTLRLSCSGTDKMELETALDQEITKIPAIVSERIISYDGENIEQIIGRILKQRKQTIATAESCTGGSIAAAITSVSGSSAWFVGSVVAYANTIKQNILHVPAQDIEQHGAVSETVVKAMAKGVQSIMQTNWSVAISGIAGPDGGSEEKPVGTVWIAIAQGNNTIAKKYKFGNSGRDVIIRRSVMAALLFLLEQLNESK